MADLGPLPEVRRRPLVGIAGGLLFGLGLAALLVIYAKIAIGTRPPIAIVIICTLLGGIWGLWGPIRTVGKPPSVGRPQADERVRQAMRDNLAAIDQAERVQPADHPPPPDPTPALPDVEPSPEPEPDPLPDIGPPGEGVWHGSQAERNTDAPEPPESERPGSEPPRDERT